MVIMGQTVLTTMCVIKDGTKVYLYDCLMNYDIKKLSDNKVELTYSQLKKDEKELSFIDKFIFERRIKKWMKLIEKEMIKRRNAQ